MNKSVPMDSSGYCKSGFRMTFAIELLNMDVWHDCNEGMLELGPCVQGLKLQYSLYPGHHYEIDVLIWPHTAKIWCGLEQGWVRTWMFLNRRWLAFSIQHSFPVRVREFQYHVVSITPTTGVASLSNNAKNDKNYQVFLPPLGFGDLRYFAGVCDIDSVTPEESLQVFIGDLIWKKIESFIPRSFLDGKFDIPETVLDARHQDSVLLNVRESLLRRSSVKEETIDTEDVVVKMTKNKNGKKGVDKEKDKKKGPEMKVKFELRLTGDEILAGAGRVISFESIGDRPTDVGEIIALISSSNLPAQDDDPVFFVNIENLIQVPYEDLKKLSIVQIYTTWKLGDEEHSSDPQPVKETSIIELKDHHAVVLKSSVAAITTNCFLEDYYEIQLHGIKNRQNVFATPVFFGYDKNDRDYDKNLLGKSYNDETDFIIAVAKIETRNIVKGFSTYIGGEYPLFPPMESTIEYGRPRYCTNDINSIGLSIKSRIVPSSLILKSQMSLEVSLGFVGCRPPKLAACFSRLYALVNDSEIMTSILKKASELNKVLINTDQKKDMLTGLAIDTGDVVFLYIEGPKDGSILSVWEMTKDFYPKMKPLFSSSARFLSRLYPDLLITATPIKVYKMYVPLSALLACPIVYVRPTLPLPTRSAVVKIGALIAKRLRVTPSRSEMPTSSELRSFKLELCVPPRPAAAVN